MKEKLIKLLGEDNGWIDRLLPILTSTDLNRTFAHLNFLKQRSTIFPDPKNILKAFKLCPWDDVKVVILGQDPYYTHSKTVVDDKPVAYATGLAFGIPEEVNIMPGSLRNIFKEIRDSEATGFPDDLYFDTTLESWAQQGILLLNTALTVEKGKAGSHAKLWETFTEGVLKELSSNNSGIVYVLWGNHAKGYKKYINEDTNFILESAHPSPLSAHKGFLGCNHFNKINEYLMNTNGLTIKW